MKVTGKSVYRSLLTGVATLTCAATVGLVGVAQAQAPRLVSPPVGIESQLSFADLVEQVSPAVVSIYTERTVERPELPEEFERFFGPRLTPELREQFQQQQQQQFMAQGSGFFVDSEGHIVTNNHVIAEADVINVRLTDGTEFQAELIGTDEATDLAVLKVDSPRSQPYVNFAKNVNLRVGDWVVAVGNPFGLGGTVTSGIVSAVNRDRNFSTYNDFIQIDAPINRGNSGGPTFDLSGRVVGVNTAIISPSGASAGIGFAIPADTAAYIVDQLIEKGSVTRGWLGVEIRNFDNNHAAAVGLDTSEGALIVNVSDDTPAARAGLRDGDIVLAMNEQPIDSSRALTRAVANVQPDNTVGLSVYRDGRVRTINVTLGDRNELAQFENPEYSFEELEEEDTSLDELGVKFGPLTREYRERLDLGDEVQGVVVTQVLPGGAAEEAGLAYGMVILEADNRAVTSPEELENAIAEKIDEGKEALLLRIQAAGRRDYRALPLQEDS